MVASVAGGIHHTHAPSFGCGILGIAFRAADKFVIFAIAQGNFFSFVAHDKFRVPIVFIVAVDHEFLGSYMVNVVHAASGTVSCQIGFYEL